MFVNTLWRQPQVSCKLHSQKQSTAVAKNPFELGSRRKRSCTVVETIFLNSRPLTWLLDSCLCCLRTPLHGYCQSLLFENPSDTTSSRVLVKITKIKICTIRLVPRITAYHHLWNPFSCYSTRIIMSERRSRIICICNYHGGQCPKFCLIP